jgi:hypothetical protein
MASPSEILMQRRTFASTPFRLGRRWLLLAAGIGGCQAHSLPPAPSPIALLRHSISREVAQNSYWKRYARMAADSMTVRSTASRVVPGLVYHHGYFVPPQTADVGPFTAVVGARGGVARVLAAPADWEALVGEWEPRDGAAAVSACVEVMDEASGAFRGIMEMVFLDSAQLVTSVSVPEPGQLLARISPPQVVVSDGREWTVRLWAVRVERSVQVDCRIAPAKRRPRVSITPRDSIPLGMMALS